MKFFKVIQNKFIFHLLGIIFFRVLLDWVYISTISTTYRYSGFLNESTIKSTIISWLVLLLLTPRIIYFYRIPKISANVVILLFLSSFVPMTSLMRFMPMGNRFLFLYMIYWILLLYLYSIIPSFTFSNKNAKRSKSLLFVLLIMLSLGVLYTSGRYFNFRLHFSLSDVYTLRMEERSLNLPTFLKYLLPAAGNILPFFLVYYLYKKENKIAIAIAIIIIFNYSIGGHKSVIFLLFLCFLGYWLYNERRVIYFSWGLSIITLLSLIQIRIFDSLSIAAVLIRRVFFLPSLLNYHYYDFFTKNEPDYFRQGILRWFGFSSPYEAPIPKIIGYTFYDNVDTNANNGLFSDAYYNLNALGVFIFPVILIVIFKLFDTCAKGLDSKLWIMPIIVALTFKSSSFSSVLLTNGVILVLVSLYLIPRNKVTKSI